MSDALGLVEITLLSALWAVACSGLVLWLCPRLFRFTPEDDE